MQQRLEKLCALFQGAGIDSMYITDPQNRYYLSCFTGTTGALLILPDRAYIITDSRYSEQANIECPGFIVNETKESVIATLNNIVLKEDITSLGFEAEHVVYNQHQLLKDSLKSVGIIPVTGLVEELRLRKDAQELYIMERAAGIADDAFKEILPFIKPGVPEREIALKLEYFMQQMDADGVAFKIIVASGVRSALPHGVASTKKIQEGDLVTLDFGANYRGYNSDITRTIAVGKTKNKQEEIYKVVLAAQLNAISFLRQGVQAYEVDHAARGTIEAAGYGEYFRHSTGHGLGLNVHENPRLSIKDQSLLQPGMVFTVEPGIYLPGWGGVRIEDTVLLEEEGPKVLTKSPKEQLIIL